MNLYATHGVKEYWLVTPFPPLVEIFVLDHGGYRFHSGYQETGIAISREFPDLTIDLSQVFSSPSDEQEKNILKLRDQRKRYLESATPKTKA